jgi:hypothetical protein
MRQGGKSRGKEAIDAHAGLIGSHDHLLNTNELWHDRHCRLDSGALRLRLGPPLGSASRFGRW